MASRGANRLRSVALTKHLRLQDAGPAKLCFRTAANQHQQRYRLDTRGSSRALTGVFHIDQETTVSYSHDFESFESTRQLNLLSMHDVFRFDRAPLGPCTYLERH